MSSFWLDFVLVAHVCWEPICYTVDSVISSVQTYGVKACPALNCSTSEFLLGNQINGHGIGSYPSVA